MTGRSGRSLSGWRGWLLIAVTVAAILVALLAPAMPQPLAYHEFADQRTLWSVPHALNVLSNLPFLAGGIAGLLLLVRGGNFIDRRERRSYVVFFLGASLTCCGSAWYHLDPDNQRLVWDRLPMTLGFAGLVSAAVAERVDRELGLKILWPLLAIGAGTVFWWQFTELRGVGNVMPYGAFQGWSVLVILVLITAFRAGPYTHGSLLAWAAGWYALAKIFEAADRWIFESSAGWVSGHSIKHLLAAGAVFAVLRQLRLRAAQPAPKLALPT